MEFKKYGKRIKVNGHPVEVQIEVRVEEDPDAEDGFGMPAAEGFFYGSILVLATAPFDAGIELEGIDSLGGCELRPNNMFDSTPFNKSVEEILETYGMEANAVNDLRKQIEGRYDELVRRAELFKKFKRGAK